jgi:hypothetical protein
LNTAFDKKAEFFLNLKIVSQLPTMARRVWGSKDAVRSRAISVTSPF